MTRPKKTPRLHAYFEGLIDPFRAAADVAPPTTALAYYRHYLRQVSPALAGLLVVGFVMVVIEVLMLQFLGKVLDMAVSSGPGDFFSTHAAALAAMVAVILIARPIVLGLHNLYLGQCFNPGLTGLVRWQTHRYVLKQSMSFFNNDQAGRVAKRVMHTGEALRISAGEAVDGIWHAVVYIVSALFLFSRADWRLILPLGIWLVIYAVAMLMLVKRLDVKSEAHASAEAEVMGRVVDGYTNIATLKLFGHSGVEEAYARDALADQIEKNRAFERIITVMDTLGGVLNALLILGTAGLALWLWSDDVVTLGVVTVAVGLVLRINEMSNWLLFVVSAIFQNVGTVRDGIQSLSAPRAVQDHVHARELSVTRAAIDVRNASFSYDRNVPVFTDLNITIAPGEKIGLVGPSGAGKSTLVQLLLRMYDLQGGRIAIDDQDISEVTQDSLRARISVVSQESSLLHRTLRENLRYGRPDASDAQIMQALEDAHAWDFVRDIQDGEGRVGLDAMVGERGIKLSGGQRQRIAIARALLKASPILVLDEATSALDSEVEAAIQENLQGLFEGRTVLAIAHRLSTIARMDRLLIMVQGRIVESGTHEALLAAGGVYAGLWQRQTGGFLAT